MKITRTQSEIEVLKSCDVVVVGGGPAGCGAAVAAARQGAKVMLIEKRGFLGGNITACYVEHCNYFLYGKNFEKLGLYGEITRDFAKKYGLDNVRPGDKQFFHSEYLKVFLDDLMKENHVEVLLHSFVNEVVKEDEMIRAVVIQTKKGPVAVLPKIVIDASGDGDVAFAAGVPYEQGRDSDGLCQPGTVSVRLAGADVEALTKDGEDVLKTLGKQFERDYLDGKTGLPCKRKDIPFGRLTPAGIISYVNYACTYFIDPTDVQDLTRGEMECRGYIMDIYRYMKEHWAPFKNTEIASMSPEIGFRDSRRIRGHYHLTIGDMESQKHFEDCIAAFPRFYDMLAPDANMFGNGRVEGKGYEGHIYEPVIEGRYFEIPYRSLVPAEMDNLLVAGRCIDSDHVAESGVRAISLCMMMGQAAGTAAALSVEQGCVPLNVDMEKLQGILRKADLWIPEGA